ncbi:hypothetical protein HanXRQr2_Chr17g0806241 [Helianthus annuus]|uniref:Uncharacterized protein n=1 Tax=Helianthus annuus TaxID=4232 RepID=A0A9K3DI01_HELAN|nr:hypothetical protein HanXRQr2_Chr17g0806241 [Helianthus annuus]
MLSWGKNSFNSCHVSVCQISSITIKYLRPIRCLCTISRSRELLAFSMSS